ncbi:MAG: ribonuclease R, partial [Thermodesulfobacteriota bacterium]|nr:ribonuclease R [Thermodesulfobacteriota bacterium]
MAKKKKSKRIEPAHVLKVFRESGTPMRRAGILRALGAVRADKKKLREVLGRLLDQGKIIRTKGGAFGLAESMRLVSGTLDVKRSGVGFVTPNDKRRKDIFISRGNMEDAWHGDTVVAAVSSYQRKGGNPEGRVVRVLKRAVKSIPALVGQKLGPRLYLCRPTDPRFGFNLTTGTAKLPEPPKSGDVVLVTPDKRLEHGLWSGTATELLGPEYDVGVQERLVKAAHRIPLSFSQKTLDQAEALPHEPTAKDLENRKDLRSLPFVTIDGAKARDFDDAVHVTKEKNGFLLRVAIADVSHYVAPGQALDREAFVRANSYYFPQSVEPMFPEALSNGLCSLNPNVSRLAVVAEIRFKKNGAPAGERFYPTVIKSRARLTYGQVHRALSLNDKQEQKRLSPVLPMLRQAEKLARILIRARNARGSLDFDLPEPEIMFNLYGETTDIRPRPRNFAHQIIEEFMIAANEAAARFLTLKGLPCLYRVHPDPDPEKLRSLFSLLSRTDLAPSLPAEATPNALHDLLLAAKDTPLEFVVHRLALRSMKQAGYSPENTGHFGLASECYCHFTSPIRRYADLVVHRSLKAALKGEGPPPGPRKAQRSADHLNLRERDAMEAEREILKRLTIIFLRDRVGEAFTGIISGLADFGFWVELNEVMAEGMVRLSTLTDDYYVFLPDRQELIGERTGKRFKLGQSVRVRLAE